MQRVFFQPLLAKLNLIIIAVKDALRSLTAEDRQTFALFILVGEKFGLPGNITVLEYVLLDI